MTSAATTGTARPGSLAEARDALLGARRDGAILDFRGGGTKAGWGARPRRTDLIVETGALDRLVKHERGDLTAEVEAGIPLARLQAELAEAGQWLAIDPPHVADGATVGGVLAANDAGPRRLRYGAMRDMVIGTTVVLADGTIASSGGHVIKNVAGYDLVKLYCGSLGTLGLITTVVVRLQPLPEATRTLRVDADAAAATAITLELLAGVAEPSALEWRDTDGLLVRFDGREAGLDVRAEALRAVAARRELESTEVDAAVWDSLGDAHAGVAGETLARAATLPSALPDAARALREAAAEADVAVALASSVGLGLHSARLSGDDAGAHARVVDGWRRRVAALGGTVVVRRQAPGLDVDAWGPPPSAVDLMRRVKQRLDPDDRCAPGRFPGAI